jgi:hypothetical protein
MPRSSPKLEAGLLAEGAGAMTGAQPRSSIALLKLVGSETDVMERRMGPLPDKHAKGT